MSVAPDGSPVDVDLRLPERGEGELVLAAVPAPASLARARLRHRPRHAAAARARLRRHRRRRVAGDARPRAERCRALCAGIEEVELARSFDAALLLSNLLTTEPPQRRAFLDTCGRHSNVLVVESLPLGFAPQASDWLRIDRFEEGVVHGAVVYEGGWSHAFAMRVFADERELDEALGECGRRLERWLDPERGWFTAARAPG